VTCAVCGHDREHHGLYGGWCDWKYLPESPTSSIFCKCMRFTEREVS